jgi:hypothetical protein
MNIASKDIVKVLNIKQKGNVYIIDFLNVFSDYREILYKRSNIDFHKVKHSRKYQDTLSFFDLFFSKYIKFANIDIQGQFIVVMKKLNDYYPIICTVLHRFSDYDIKFVVINNQFNDTILDKNKDDYLCQYFFRSFEQFNPKCVLISNDNYKDRDQYIYAMNFPLQLSVIDMKYTIELNFESSRNIMDKLHKNIQTRCCIPKRNLGVLFQ